MKTQIAHLEGILGVVTFEPKKTRGREQMRRASTKVTRRNKALLERIGQIKSDHPFWGCRRVLRYVDGLLVNKKRIWSLMKEHNLTVKPNHKLKAE